MIKCLFLTVQYVIGFKIHEVDLYNLMFWWYMADRKFIDVKPTRREIVSYVYKRLL